MRFNFTVGKSKLNINKALQHRVAKLLGKIVPSSKKKKPYSERSDIEKIQSNWKKIAGLLSREEWSGSIIRATTATEIAANLVIREELIDDRQLDSSLVDHFLLWVNGIQGKFDKLILPMIKGKDHEKEFKKLKNASKISIEKETQ